MKQSWCRLRACGRKGEQQMSTEGTRDIRPETHYTPPYGWTNDPNGLVYDNGIWHLFAQHYPDATHWGPMHWRHATSTDLLCWKDEGIALYPDEKLGFAFSGSAVIDHGNTSGLGTSSSPMVLMFTHHGDYEQQSIAVSDDRTHFTLYSGNPVIPNSDKPNFRDPKVFRNDALDCWSCVIAAGDHYEFYASADLIHWRKTGEFGTKENRLGGIFECPDLFPLKAPDGRTVWVLIASTLLPFTFGGVRMQYFLGDFDGETFRETIPADQPRILDSGKDNYAAVTFSGTDRRLLMGWAESMVYGPDAPTNEFCGLMTYARELSLVNTDCGIQLAFSPVAPEFDLAEVPSAVKSEAPSLFEPAKTEGTLPGELFHIRVEAPAAFTLTLSNEDGEAFHISINNEQSLIVDRSQSGHNKINALYDSGLFSFMAASRKMHGPVTLDLYFDHMIAEIYTDEGTVVNTSVVFPAKPYTKATLLGEGKLWIGKPASGCI